MKGIISKVPVTIAERSGTRQGIVFLAITNDERKTEAGFRNIEVTDYEVTLRENAQPGEQKYNYTPIDRNTRKRLFSQTNQIWQYLAKDLVHTQPLEEQLDQLYADFLLVDTQQEPIRDSQPGDWEIHEKGEKIPEE